MVSIETAAGIVEKRGGVVSCRPAEGVSARREAVQLHGGHYSVAKDGLEDQLPPVLNSVRQVVASRAG